MKSSSLFSATAILPLMGLLTLSACQGVIFPEEEYPEFSEHKLTVLTRSTTPLSSMPVQVFAFDADGRLLDSRNVVSTDEGIALSLPPVKCRIVAASGGEVTDASPSLQDIMSMPEANYSTHPIVLGLADVTMGDKPQTLNVQMVNRVAQLSLTLKDVPDEVTDVHVSVSSPYSQISLQGEMQQPLTAGIPCIRSGSEWSTGTVYVLPTSQQNAVFSIQLTYGERKETYGYTYASGLVANTPYIMYGSYQDGVTLNGSFILQDWENAVEHSFHFGPGVNDSPVIEPEPQDEVILVDEIPEPGTLWDGHVVAGVSDTESGANLLLVSRMEWDGMTSAFFEENPNVARNLASQYDEDQVKGWRIPTREEAQWLVQGYVDRLDELNELMETAGGMPMLSVDDKLSTVRYLCEDATYSFALLPGSKLTKAGSKLNTYHLRLVKTVSVTVP